MPVPPAEVVVLVAHPALEASRANRALARAAARAIERVEVRDLYALYPDYLINTALEQSRLAAARLIVWQHPVHWYGMTPLMKLWLDEVLTFGWAYGPGGTALRGKDLWLVATTGGAESSYRPESYNRYPFDAFLPPYEQTAVACGMRFLPPMVLHGTLDLDAATIDAHAALYAERLAAYPAWPELEGIEDCPQCAVPWNARPHPAIAVAPPQVASSASGSASGSASLSASASTPAAARGPR